MSGIIDKCIVQDGMKLFFFKSQYHILVVLVHGKENLAFTVPDHIPNGETLLHILEGLSDKRWNKQYLLSGHNVTIEILERTLKR